MLSAPIAAVSLIFLISRRVCVFKIFMMRWTKSFAGGGDYLCKTHYFERFHKDNAYSGIGVCVVVCFITFLGLVMKAVINLAVHARQQPLRVSATVLIRVS